MTEKFLEFKRREQSAVSKAQDLTNKRNVIIILMYVHHGYLVRMREIQGVILFYRCGETHSIIRL